MSWKLKIAVWHMGRITAESIPIKGNYRAKVRGRCMASLGCRSAPLVMCKLRVNLNVSGRGTARVHQVESIQVQRVHDYGTINCIDYKFCKNEELERKQCVS